MSLTNALILETIKTLIYTIIEEEYKNYLERHKLLLIEKTFGDVVVGSL